MSDSTCPHSAIHGLDVDEMDATLVHLVEVIGLDASGIGDE